MRQEHGIHRDARKRGAPPSPSQPLWQRIAHVYSSMPRSIQLAPPVDRFGPRRSLSRCALSLSMPALCYDIFPYDMPTFAYCFVLASDRLSYCDRCPVSYSVPRTFLSRSRVSCLVAPHSLPILPVLPSYLHYCPLPYFFYFIIIYFPFPCALGYKNLCSTSL